MAVPTLAGCDGFEHGAVGTGVAGVYDVATGTPAIVTTTPRTGARCLEISTTAQAEYVSYSGLTSRTVTQVVFVRFPTSLPTADANLVAFVNANGNGSVRYQNSSGRFGLVAGSSSVLAGGPASLAADTWYRILIEYDTTTGTATTTCRIDGGTAWAQTASQTAADITAIRLGTGAADTFTARFDDWCWSVTDGDYEIIRDDIATTHPQVEELLPTSDGTHSISGANEMERTATGTDIINSTTDAYLLVDDAPLDVTPTDYVNDVGTNAASYVEVVFQDLPSSTDVPLLVRAYTVDRDSTGTGTSAAVSRIVLDDGTSVSPDLRLSSDDPGVTVTVREKVLTAPGGSWDRTEVDGLRARMGFGDGAPDVWFAGFMLEVALVPAGGTDATVTPATIAAVAAVPQAGPQAGVSITPATVARSFTVPDVDERAGATITPTTIARAFTVDQAGPRAGVTITPATIARSFTIPDPDERAGVTLTPAVIARSFVIDQTAAGGFITITPTTIARSFVIDQTGPRAGVTLTPTTIARTFTIDQAGPQAGATVTPTTIARSFVIDQTAKLAGVTVTPTTIARLFVIDQVTVITEGGATVTPTTIARAFTLPQAGPQAGSSVTPAVIARAFVLPQASPQAGSSVTPATIARAFVIPQVEAGAFAVVTPAVIARAFAIDQAVPIVAVGATVTPATIAAVLAVFTPGLVAHSSVTPQPIALLITIPGVGVVLVPPLIVTREGPGTPGAPAGGLLRVTSGPLAGGAGAGPVGIITREGS